MKKWLKLDNAAKIFPSVSTKYRTNLYRITFSLTESVDPIILQEALNDTIKRLKDDNKMDGYMQEALKLAEK